MASRKEPISKTKVGSRKAAEKARAEKKQAPPAPPAPGAPPRIEGAYTVLARKYRPRTFDDLIGQDAMVKTLRNAFASGRIAQAYMLTGVRGVGKTTTARILARALNYEGPEGVDGPSLEMPGLGEHCAEIMASRHIDVLEMDAASNTGIDDVREIIESARYKPVRARYKVYIIDEVHMLSKAAFNGLLKTLEEPPEHVKFIFATTEARKVPVTVLSRCQRFDLRRIDVERLIEHFKKIAALESHEIADEAIALIARAAQGSVRDGLSLLDQAIAHAAGRVEAGDVRAMLGLAERVRVFDILEAALAGDAAKAIAVFDELYDDGADPSEILADLADVVHVVARIKAAGAGLADPSLSEAERARAAELSERLGMAQLARAWQLLFKGHGEVLAAPRPLAAAEMVLVRLAYAADLPSPAELIAGLETAPASARVGGAGETTGERAAAPPPASGAGGSRVRAGGGSALPIAEPESEAAGEPAEEPLGDPIAWDRAEDAPQPAPPQPESLADVVALAKQNRDLKLCRALEEQVALVRFGEGRIELRLLEDAPPGLAGELGAKLERWTGRRWIVSVSDEEGEATLAEQARQRAAKERAEIERHPAVRAVFERFPEARIKDVRPAAPREDGE